LTNTSRPPLHPNDLERYDSKRVHEHFSRNAQPWKRLYENGAIQGGYHAALVLRKEILLSVLKKYLDAKSITVLDAGSGPGGVSKEFAARGHKVTALDLSSEMLKQIDTPKEGPHRIAAVNADVRHLPFYDRQYELILCLGVIQYLADEDLCLIELSRAIAEKGHLAMSFPNKAKLHHFFDPNTLFGIARRVFRLPAHREVSTLCQPKKVHSKLYRLKKIQTMMAQFGFRIIAIKAVDFGPLTFFGKEFLPLTIAVGLSKCLSKISTVPLFSWLKFFTNQWIILFVKE
jgi:2-polyprenyl-3-methyl-5-hydroxy-6-metoxy-1,4-benzoquinol methylase